MRILASIAALLGIIYFNACTSDKAISKEQLEIYSIVLNKDSVAVGNLTYKDIKYFDEDNHLVKQEFFDKKNKLKGTEYIDRSKTERHSEYYDVDSNLLSYYNLVYKSDTLRLKTAYDGQSNQLLRTELYLYDENGNRTEKQIVDENNKLDRVYKFTYDEFGNETGFSGFDEEGQLFLIETYKITKQDDQNRWTERWSYREKVPFTFATRKLN